MAGLVAVVASCARIYRPLVRRRAHSPELDSVCGSLCPQVSSDRPNPGYHQWHQCGPYSYVHAYLVAGVAVTQFVIGINYNPETICPFAVIYSIWPCRTHGPSSWPTTTATLSRASNKGSPSTGS